MNISLFAMIKNVFYSQTEEIPAVDSASFRAKKRNLAFIELNGISVS